jgi:predicted nucleic acid-binding protein
MAACTDLMKMNSAGAVVLDANIAISLCAMESTASKVQQSLFRYTVRNSQFYAPGVLIAETLYILCQKSQNGTLTPTEYAAAIVDFDVLLSFVVPPPRGDASLMLRAEQIRSGYGCSRSADGLYIALAEELSQSQPTTLLTLDAGVSHQAAQNAPAVIVDLLIP